MNKIDYASDAAMLGISVERYTKSRKAFDRNQARNLKGRRCVPRPFDCHGGPFDHGEIWLTGMHSMIFRVGNWRGQYQSGYWVAT
jgi:hypothetical protein